MKKNHNFHLIYMQALKVEHQNGQYPQARTIRVYTQDHRRKTIKKIAVLSLRHLKVHLAKNKTVPGSRTESKNQKKNFKTQFARNKVTIVKDRYQIVQQKQKDLQKNLTLKVAIKFREKLILKNNHHKNPIQSHLMKKLLQFKNRLRD